MVKKKNKQTRKSRKATNKNQKTKKTNQMTEKGYKAAIEASNGTVTDIARRLKITCGSVSLYLDKHPEIRVLLEKKRMTNVDLAEGVLFQNLDFDDLDDPVPAARIRQRSAEYITSRLGKKNGWVEKQEVEHSGEQQIIFQEVVLSNEEIKELKNDKTNNPKPKTA